MFTLPICLATLPPSRPPSASPTAPVALADSEPVTLSVPVSGVVSVSASCAPVAAIGPREAVQPISAFCRICEMGFSALPLKARGELRSAASRIAVSATAIGAITVELRGAAASGGNSTSAGGLTVPRGASQSIAFRLIRNETAITATPIRIVLECIGRRIVPPDRLSPGIFGPLRAKKTRQKQGWSPTGSGGSFTGTGRAAPERDQAGRRMR